VSPAPTPPNGAGSYFAPTPPFAPAASTPPAQQSGGLFGITPSSAGMASPGVRAGLPPASRARLFVCASDAWRRQSSFGAIETGDDLERYIEFSERQRSDGSLLVGASMQRRGLVARRYDDDSSRQLALTCGSACAAQRRPTTCGC
jgi:hypothetical protein